MFARSPGSFKTRRETGESLTSKALVFGACHKGPRAGESCHEGFRVLPAFHRVFLGRPSPFSFVSSTKTTREVFFKRLEIVLSLLLSPQGPLQGKYP